MPIGRRTLDTDTRPGQVLALALLANAPIALAFVLAPLLGGPEQARSMTPLVLWTVPPLAVASIVVFVRAPPERRAHRAARIGIVLDAVALLLWVLVLFAPGR